MLERDFLFFFVTPIGLYIVGSLLLCYRLQRQRSLRIGQALLLGGVLVIGFCILVAIVGFFFMAYHPMDPPGS
ncbi:hypothetical protein [Hymenobacter crusticola]|uniref:Uncharacterized protein n=1 Tax=Hymenobacter crusticola TaxID=1770526 RepID=A0A243W523_9BACT|nr:hypothetical protein [Hymenobacter crusticola]OUJ65516.1 hypothetical protein BXP70_29160 [Hymenobacter crusticola]